MKLKLALACLAVTFVSFTKAQTLPKALVDKAKQKVQTYIKLKEPNAQTYKPLGWAPLDKIEQPEIGNMLLVKTANKLLIAKIDTLRMLQNAFPGPRAAYSQMHVFTIKEGTKTAQKVYSFYLDKNMEVVSVDKDSPEVQIEKQKKLLADADEKIRLIKEINTLEKSN